MNYDKLYDIKCVYRLQPKDTEELKSYFYKKQGWVYIAKSKDNPHLKIGRTSKNPLERAKTLSSTGVFSHYEIIFSMKAFNQFWVEKIIHDKLKRFRISKEFFSVQESLAIDAIENTVIEESILLKRFLKLEIITEDIELIEYSLKK
jgi:hypothetical protein